MYYLPLVICLLGLLLYAFAEPRLSVLGKDMFWVGLLVTLLRMSSVVIK